MTIELGYLTLCNMPVDVNATSPVPQEGEGSIIWSTSAKEVLRWDGAKWTVHGPNASVATTRPSVRPSLLLAFSNINLVDSRLIFSRSSTAYSYNRLGTYSSVPADSPRIDYDPFTFQNQGLLLEAATTNYLLHSTDVSHAVWLKQNNGGASVPVVTPNYGLAPDGTLAAARVQMKLNGGSTTNDYCRIYQPASVAVGTMYSNSVYVKTIDGSTRTVLLMDDTGGVTSSSPLVNIDGNWKRLSASAVATTTQCNAASIWLFGSQGTSDSVDILVWGGQLEPSMMPTSLLPTDNSSISRSIENASVSLSSGNVFTNLNGSVYVEAYSGSGSGSRVLLQMTSAPALGENVSLTYNPDTELCVMSYQVGVTETIYYSQATHVSKNDTVKCVVSIEKGNVHMAINGAIVPVDNAGGFPSNLDTLTLMPSTVSGGHVKRLSVYPRKLTDDELLALTLL